MNVKLNPILVFIIYLICTFEAVQAKDSFVTQSSVDDTKSLDVWNFLGKGVSNNEGKLAGGLVSVAYNVSDKTAVSFSFEKKGRSETSGVYFILSSEL